MTRYLPEPRADADPSALPVFCFPFAGGGTSAYAGWQRQLGPAVRVLPVRLPGREARIAERRFTDLAELVAELDEQLGPELEQPHVLYGHSMGALIAFTLARRRYERGRPLPLALVLSAYRPPHLPIPRIDGVEGSEGELISALLTLGGVPKEIVARPEWAAVLLPIARDDLRMCLNVPPSPTEPTPVPIHAFAGRDDILVAPAEVGEWSRHTDREFGMKILPGGHFFIKEREPAFLGQLSALLERYGRERETAGALVNATGALVNAASVA